MTGAKTGPAETTVPSGPTMTATREEELDGALGDLAASYSAQHGGAPVFVALTSRPLFPLEAPTARTPSDQAEVVVVQLVPGASPHSAISSWPAELVGSSGVTGETAYAVNTSSASLGKGGSFDYQFLLPGTGWQRLALDLGSSSGSSTGPALFKVSAYNYATNAWDALGVRPAGGQLTVPVPDPKRYLGPSGALQVRFAALQQDVEVYGAFPTLSATPTAARQ
jgi:hypothetical protein